MTKCLGFDIIFLMINRLFTLRSEREELITDNPGVDPTDATDFDPFSDLEPHAPLKGTTDPVIADMFNIPLLEYEDNREDSASEKPNTRNEIRRKLALAGGAVLLFATSVLVLRNMNEVNNDHLKEVELCVENQRPDLGDITIKSDPERGHIIKPAHVMEDIDNCLDQVNK